MTTTIALTPPNLGQSLRPAPNTIQAPPRFDAFGVGVVRSAIAACRNEVVGLDCSAVRFVDQAALEAVEAAALACLTEGRTLMLVDPSPTMTVTLRLVGMDRLLPDRLVVPQAV